MGFNYSILVAEDVFVWKCRRDDVELICELDRDHNVNNVFSKSVSEYTSSKHMNDVAEALPLLLAQVQKSDYPDADQRVKEIQKLLQFLGEDSTSKISVRELTNQIDALLAAFEANKDTLLTDYTVKIYNPKSGRFRKFKAKTDWLHIEWDQEHTTIVAQHRLFYGKRTCELVCYHNEIKTTNDIESKDLRGFEEYILPDGAKIKIERSPREDTLSERLNELREWLTKRDPNALLQVIAGRRP